MQSIVRKAYEEVDGQYGSNREKREVLVEMKDILVSEGWFVAEDTAELKELALAETSLVEPEDE